MLLFCKNLFVLSLLVLLKSRLELSIWNNVGTFQPRVGKYFVESEKFLKENGFNQIHKLLGELELLVDFADSLQKLVPKLVHVLRIDELIEGVSRAVFLIERHEGSHKADEDFATSEHRLCQLHTFTLIVQLRPSTYFHLPLVIYQDARGEEVGVNDSGFEFIGRVESFHDLPEVSPGHLFAHSSIFGQVVVEISSERLLHHDDV